MIAQDYKRLSPRECQVLQAAWEGLTHEEIGYRLHITRKTVDFHKGMILRKWECRNFLTVCRLALERGYLEL